MMQCDKGDAKLAFNKFLATSVGLIIVLFVLPQFSLTPLHLACWYGQESVAKLLLEHGADVNAADKVSLKNTS